MQRLSAGRDSVNRVALTQRQVQIALLVEHHRPWTVERGTFDRRTVRRRLRDAGAGPRVDALGDKIDSANPLVADIADEQLPLTIDDDAVRLAELSLRRGATVAGKPGDVRAGKRRDHAGRAVDFSNDMVVTLGNVEMTARVELNFVRHVQRRRRRRSAVTGVAFLSAAGDGCQATRLEVEATDALIVEIAKVQRAVRTEDDAVRVVDLLIGKAAGACADERRNNRRRPRASSGKSERQ